MIAELHGVDHIHIVSQKLQGERGSSVSCNKDQGELALPVEVILEAHQHIRKRRVTARKEADLLAGTASCV